jgi:hypothetical protein
MVVCVRRNTAAGRRVARGGDGVAGEGGVPATVPSGVVMGSVIDVSRRLEAMEHLDGMTDAARWHLAGWSTNTLYIDSIRVHTYINVCLHLFCTRMHKI